VDKCGGTLEILHCFSFISEAGSKVIECDVKEELNGGLRRMIQNSYLQEPESE